MYSLFPAEQRNLNIDTFLIELGKKYEEQINNFRSGIIYSTLHFYKESASTISKFRHYVNKVINNFKNKIEDD